MKKALVVALIFGLPWGCGHTSAPSVLQANPEPGLVCTDTPARALCGQVDQENDACLIPFTVYEQVLFWPACQNWGRQLSLEELAALRVCRFVYKKPVMGAIYGSPIVQTFCAVDVPVEPQLQSVQIEAPAFAVIKTQQGEQKYLVALKGSSVVGNVETGVELCCNQNLNTTSVYVLGLKDEQHHIFPRYLGPSNIGIDSVPDCSLVHSQPEHFAKALSAASVHGKVQASLDYHLSEQQRMHKLLGGDMSWYSFSQTLAVAGLPGTGKAGLVLLEGANLSLGFSLSLTGADFWLTDPFVFFENNPLTVTILIAVDNAHQLQAVTYATNITKLVAWQPVFEKIRYPDELTLVPDSLDPESPLPPLATLPLTSYTWYTPDCREK